MKMTERAGNCWDRCWLADGQQFCWP